MARIVGKVVDNKNIDKWEERTLTHLLILRT